MVFKAERTIAIPTKDLLSWTFDDNKFDQDEPVISPMCPASHTFDVDLEIG
jgi:hypothetical protein